VVVGKGVTHAGDISLIGTISFGYVVARLPSSIAADYEPLEPGFAEFFGRESRHIESVKAWERSGGAGVKGYGPEALGSQQGIYIARAQEVGIASGASEGRICRCIAYMVNREGRYVA
jgi:hypothetical protein